MDTDDVINLSNLLDFNPIKNYFKLCIYSYMNGIILDVTFKFSIRSNMQLIYNCFYTLRKSKD
jgi:hypothetical protein